MLSGTGSDGSEGLRAIKAESGVTFAQAPRTAKFAGMPEAAVQAGVVDFALPIPALAQELLRIGSHPFVRGRATEVLAGRADDGDLKKVLVLLRNTVGADFSGYKLNSIRRRLGRRMALHRLESLSDYVRLLRDDRAEAEALFDDLLIQVTSFFRDAAAFAKLKERVFPEILKQKRAGGTIRIWCAGCATGEEAYSIVISLLEFLAKENATDVPIQLFGTDVSLRAIEKARAGCFPDSVARDVGSERLARFFTRMDGGGYAINKSVRERCAFVKHDLASDPPFSKIDLVSCRNVLIYFDQELQKRVLAAFAFALNQPGFLLLGHAENIAEGSNLFSVVDREDKIFARTAARSTILLATSRDVYPVAAQWVEPGARAATSAEVVRRTEGILLDQYAPPGVIVNDRMEILYFRGHTGPYLEPPPGQPQHDLLKMARKGLMGEIRLAIAQARKEKTTVRRPGVRVEHDGVTGLCNVVVIPVASPPESREQVFAVLFEDVKIPLAEANEAAPPGAGPEGAAEAADPQRVARLEEQLRTTREYLQSIMQEHQQTNEDLTTSNEELMANNEELQSLNEELQTAKEELQSTNEELSTLNEELQSRNTELSLANSDLFNVLASVEVPIVIVDRERRIRRFTPKARPILNLLPSDVGRPIDDIKPTLAIENLDQKIAEVIDSVEILEEEVRGRDGRWYRLQIRPYATIDKRIDGAVLSIVDIDVLKRALGAAEWARDSARATVEAIQVPLVVLDEKLVVSSANEAFHDRYGPASGDLEGRGLYEIMGGAFNVPQLRAALGQVVEGDQRFQKLEAEREIRNLGKRSLSLSGRSILLPGGDRMVILAVEDVTERIQGEAERARLLEDAKAAEAGAAEANRTKDLFLATLSHELRTPLSTLLLQADRLRRGKMDDERLSKAGEAIARATKAQAQLIDDLLDVSRIATGKLKMELQAVRLASVVQAAAETIGPTAARRRIEVEVHVDESLPPVAGDPARLEQAVSNLLTNAIKFTPDRGRVTVTLDAAGDRERIRVTDTGIGIDPDFLPHVFTRFSQQDRGQTRTHGGLGLGLAIVRYVVEAHGGTVEAQSAGRDAGTTFTVLLPSMKGLATPVPPFEKRFVPPGHPGSIEGVRVLVVEDDPGTREALTEMLALSGAEVRSAESAGKAIEMFEEFRPGLIVCDIAMPEEDGYSLLSRIRALGPSRGGDVPALALTALAGAEDRRRALAAGFQMHIAKPVDINRLVVAAAQLVRQPPPAGAEERQPGG